MYEIYKLKAASHLLQLSFPYCVKTGHTLMKLTVIRNWSGQGIQISFSEIADITKNKVGVLTG